MTMKKNLVAVCSLLLLVFLTEDPYNFSDDVLDDLHVPTLTNDTDGSPAKRTKRWLNTFEEVLYFVCPSYSTISRISSYHSNAYQDRHFSISCGSTFSSSPSCINSGWVNNFDQPLYYICPSHYVMSGIVSYHSNYYEDHRFYIRCCRASGHYHTSCSWTPNVNFYNEYFNWYVPNHNYLAGVYSTHHNSYQDRRFRFLYCTKI